MATRPLANLLGHVCVVDESPRQHRMQRKTTVIVMSGDNVLGDADHWPVFADPGYEARLCDSLRHRVPGWDGSSVLRMTVVRPHSFSAGPFMLLDESNKLWNVEIAVNPVHSISHLLGGKVVIHFGIDTQTWLVGEDAVIDLHTCNPPEPPSVIRQDAAGQLMRLYSTDSAKCMRVDPGELHVTTFTPELLAHARATPHTVRVMMDMPFGPPTMFTDEDVMLDPVPTFGTYRLV